jgi:hypothetical protein
MKTEPKFVQLVVPRWVASLPENPKLLVGHQYIGLGESAKKPFCPDREIPKLFGHESAYPTKQERSYEAYNSGR